LEERPFDGVARDFEITRKHARRRKTGSGREVAFENRAAKPAFDAHAERLGLI
jgi:hypothetical protein